MVPFSGYAMMSGDDIASTAGATTNTHSIKGKCRHDKKS
jgi:hypothetical protein